MDQCLLRLEFQTEMFCRNSMLITLISTYWFYMNFKGHEKIQSGILKKIRTRWHEPIPKALEEACCFHFALFCFVFQHSRRRHIPPKQELFRTPFRTLHPCDIWVEIDWEGSWKRRVSDQPEQWVSFPLGLVFCYPNNSSSNNDVKKSYAFWALRFVPGIVPANISSLCNPSVLNLITSL